MTKCNQINGTECHVVTVGGRGDKAVRVFDAMEDMMGYLQRVGAMPGGKPRKAAPRTLEFVFVMGPNIQITMEATT